MSTPSLRFAALAVALLALGTALSAQGPGQGFGQGFGQSFGQGFSHGRGHGHGDGPMGEGRGLKGLNLTETQKTQMKAIHDKHQDALKAKGDSARAAHKALFDGMANAATDNTTLKALHDKVSAAKFDLLLEHRALRQEILPLLSAEQKVHFEKHAMGPMHPMGMSPRGGHGRGPGGPVVQPS